MQRSSESERFVVCSERIILECACGEKLVLLGFEDDWHSEGHTAFECECGRELTLTDRIDEGAINFDALLSRFRSSDDRP